MSKNTTRSTHRKRAPLGALVAGFAAVALVAAPVAKADPIDSGSASAFGAEVTLSTTEVVKEPVASVETVPGDAEETVVDVPADPVLVSGTLTATANVHEASDITSGLTVVEQTVAGPYNARGLGEIEDAQVLFGVAGEDVPLLSAAVIRAEAAAVCTGGTSQYTANSEIIDLVIGGTAVPANAPLTTLIDGISGALETTGLNAVVDVQRNVVTEIAGGGIAVDALVVTILDAAGETPLAQIRLAHGEVGPVDCAAVLAAAPECSDDADNDGDALIDEADPGCHTDGDATNAASYNPNDDSELDDEVARDASVLPATGGDAGILGAVLMLGLGLSAFAARRRLTA